MLKKSDTSSKGKSPEPLTVDEMKAKLLEGFVVDDGQLRLLAQQRAQHIRDFLIQNGKVPSDQVFLVEVALNPTVEKGMIQSPLALGAN